MRLGKNERKKSTWSQVYESQRQANKAKRDRMQATRLGVSWNQLRCSPAGCLSQRKLFYASFSVLAPFLSSLLVFFFSLSRRKAIHRMHGLCKKSFRDTTKCLASGRGKQGQGIQTNQRPQIRLIVVIIFFGLNLLRCFAVSFRARVEHDRQVLLCCGDPML